MPKGRCSFCHDAFNFLEGMEPRTVMFCNGPREERSWIALVHETCASDFRIWAEFHGRDPKMILDANGHHYGIDATGKEVRL